MGIRGFIQKARMFGRPNLADTSEEIDKVIKTPKGLEKDDISSGLNMYGGDEHKNEDHPVKYRTLEQRTRLYRVMTQDPTINGSLQMYQQLCRLADWSSQAASPEEFEGEGEERKAKDWDVKEAERYRLFLDQNVNDMEGCLEDIVSAALDMLPHGFNIQIPVYKFRRGPEKKNPKENSKYDDGAIGWQGFKAIDPYSVDDWDTPQGCGYLECKGFSQETISGYSTYVEKDRYVHFRTTSKNNSPTGESILVGSIEPWEQKCRHSKIEDVGMERNLEGIPVLKCPPEWLSKDATQDQKNVVAYLRNIGSSMKYNNQSYLLMPSSRDDMGNLHVEIELLSASGTARPEAARQVVEAKERLIAEAMLSQFLKLGSSSGSFALSSDMTDLFVLALRGYLDTIKATLNKQAVEKLFRLNKTLFPDAKYIPHLEYSGLEKETVGDMMNALKQAVDANLVIPTQEIQEDILKRMDLPGHQAKVEFSKMNKLQEQLMEQSINQQENPTADSPTPNSGGNAVSDITKEA